MLSLNLTPIFKARGITKPYSFLVKSGFTNFTASNLLNYGTRTFRLDHIEMLCNALVCEPNDLLLFTPDKGKQYAPNNPLHKLTNDDINNNWPDTLANMPFKELKEATKHISGKSNNI
jgi:DNA-binding Xre family transcriptional regulator